MICLREARPEDRELLWNIHQKYLYEMTNYYANEMDEHGNYHYGWFDACFCEAEYRALLIYSDGRLAGFAMTNPHSYLQQTPDHVMAEFCIFPAFRKRRIGTGAAEQIFARFPGRWELKYSEHNAGARAFWSRTTARFKPERHSFSEEETVLSFSTT